MKFADAIRAASELFGVLAYAGPPLARTMEQLRQTDERTAYLRRERPLAHDLARSVAVFSLGGWARRYPVPAYDLGEDAAVFIVNHLLAHATDTEDAMHVALERWWAEDMARQCNAWRW